MEAGQNTYKSYFAICVNQKSVVVQFELALNPQHRAFKKIPLLIM